MCTTRPTPPADTLPVADIVIGERAREDVGDLTTLASGQAAATMKSRAREM